MIVVLGASGYVGQAFAQLLDTDKREWKAVSRTDVNYYNRGELSAFLSAEKATFLINAAGFVGKPNVDACEAQQSECLRGNVVLPVVVSEACRDAKIPWGHVASGCIYNGPGPANGYSEEDAPNFCFTQRPCSFYSGTKALAEDLLKEDTNCYVWRLRMPFDEEDSPRNLLSKLLRYPRLLEATNSLSHRKDFARACLTALDKRVSFGVYNLTNQGAISTREITQVFARHGIGPKEFRFFENEAEFATTVLTPRSNCRLDTTKALAAGLPLPPVREAIERAINNWRST